MTPEEAITILKIAKTEVEWDYPLDYAVAIDTAIEALEKQIPKTPILKSGVSIIHTNKGDKPHE